MDNKTKKLFEYLLVKVCGEIPDEVKPYLSTQSFVPPTYGEVESYLREQNVLSPKENAEKFVDFYEAKGWMIGKNKMKNWKSAIKTWKLEKKGKIF